MKDEGRYVTRDVPPELINHRIKLLQAAMLKNNITGFLLTQSIDIYYFSGSMQNGFLFIPSNGETSFYVKRSIGRAAEESSLLVKGLGSYRAFGELLRGDYPNLFGNALETRIAVDLDVLPAAQYLKLEELLRVAGGCTLIDGSPIVRRIRMIKSTWEIERIEAAASVLAESLDAALPYLKEGVTELLWMAQVEHELRKRGHMGIMRLRGYNQEIVTGMVMSGAAAAMPSYFDGPAGGLGLGSAFPQNASRMPIGRNVPILIDLGCCIDGYIIDQTRTAVIGELSESLLKAYRLSELILRDAERSMIPGTLTSSIYSNAVEQCRAAGLSGHFMGYGADQARFLGHGIGLELDEWPVLANGFNEPLTPGMVIAVEPKFTFPNQGVVGIENSYAISEQGASVLTKWRQELIVL